MKILAIIPARGGSKGIPRKNIVNLNGSSLIEYTINAALESNDITDIVVSTDDIEIAEISKELGAKAPFIRPENLAQDSSESSPVVKHALNFMENHMGYEYDAILMLQPTSPLRTSKHISESIKMFKRFSYRFFTT